MSLKLESSTVAVTRNLLSYAVCCRLYHRYKQLENYFLVIITKLHMYIMMASNVYISNQFYFQHMITPLHRTLRIAFKINVVPQSSTQSKIVDKPEFTLKKSCTKINLLSVVIYMSMTSLTFCNWDFY